MVPTSAALLPRCFPLLTESSGAEARRSFQQVSLSGLPGIGLLFWDLKMSGAKEKTPPDGGATTPSWVREDAPARYGLMS